MQPSDRVMWRRRPPRRAAGRLAWTTFAAVAVVGPAWLLFAGEPAQTDDGAVNPLALILPGLGLLFAALVLPNLIALARRPVIAANHYALTVRPGVGRTLVLPWAQLAEICIREVEEGPVLLVRCGPRLSRSGDWPRWWDQANLRAARRSGIGEPIAAYDLAVPMDDFVGTPEDLLGTLADWAPGHVAVLNGLGRG